MAFKRAVMYLLAAGPIILLGLIGLNTRLHQSEWRFTEYGPATSAHLYAYAPYLSLVKELDEPHSGVTVDGALNSWLEGYREGTLRDIAPASAKFEDVSGAYAQILSSKQILMNRAIHLGENLEKSGDYREAAEIFSRVIELADIGKYGEFTSYTGAASKQALALRHIQALAPRLNSGDKLKVALSLSVLTKPRKSIVDVVENLAAAYQADRERSGETSLKIVLADSPHLLASAGGEVTDKLEQWQKLSVLEPDLIPLYGKSRVAYLQHRQVSEAAMMTIAALDLSFIN